MRGTTMRGIVAGVLYLFGASAAPAIETWRVAEVEREGQLTIYNRTAFGALLGMPVALADVDGDGLGDAILTPMNADSGPGRERGGAGEIGVVLSAGVPRGIVDLASLDPNDLPSFATLIYGRDAGDLLGTEAAAADVDGDGYADIIAGAQNADGPNDTRPGSGEVAIIWGRPDFGGRVIDTAVPGNEVTFIHGAEAGDRLGVWVFFGDLDGDGTQDVIIGADQADGPDNVRTHAGETYVVYGGAHLRATAEIDLADTDLAHTVVYGIDAEDHSGCTVRAGDLDGDGTDELLIGAGLNRLSASAVNAGPGQVAHATAGGDGPVGGRTNAGEAYALYLGPGARPASIDLRSPPGSAVFIYGADPFDAYGEELFAGDFNGDGFGDIAIGAIVGDSIDNSRLNGGDLALILGGADLPGSAVDLATPPARVTFFYGQAAGAIAGDTALFDDVDGDGLADLVIASPTAPAAGVVRAGVTHIFFGTTDPLPAVVDLAAVPESLSALLIEGADFNDMLAYSMSSGDADGDGLAEVMLNVMDGDGFENALASSGDAYVLSGAELSRAAGRLVSTDTPTPAATPTPPSSPTPTPTLDGCPGDCSGDGRVTVSELITGVRINLGLADLEGCPAMDGDGNGVITVAELVQAVRAALEGC